MNPKRQMPLLAVLKQLLPFALLALLLAAVGIMHVTSRVMVVDAGYRLSKLEGDGRELALENQRLALELATLKSPSRLEKIAREQLQMAPPPPGGVIAVAPVQGERRADGQESNRPKSQELVLGAVTPVAEGHSGFSGPSSSELHSSVQGGRVLR